MKAATNGRYLPFGALGSTVVADPVTGKLAVFSSDLIAIPVTCAPGVACSNAAGASTATCCAGTVTVWDGTGWKHAATFKNGPPLTSGTLVGDPAAHGDLYLTADGQTWLWTGVWTRKHPARTPITLNGSAAAYDASTGQVVIFGGFGLTARTDGLYDQTWTWDGTDWTMRGGSATPSVSIPVPSPVSVPRFVLHAARGQAGPRAAIACPMIPAGGVSGSSASFGCLRERSPGVGPSLPEQRQWRRWTPSMTSGSRPSRTTTTLTSRRCSSISRSWSNAISITRRRPPSS